MSRKVQLLLFAVGSAVFCYLVARIGVGKLLGDALQTGWVFVPILLLYGLVYVGNAGAWWLIMATEPSRPPFWRVWAITVSAFSLNFMTPVVNVGGEPFKIAAVAPWLGVRRAAGSAVIYQMLHTFGTLLSFLTAVVLGALLLPPRPAILAALTLTFVVLSALTLHRDDDDADPLETLESAAGTNLEPGPQVALEQSQLLDLIENEIRKLPARQREAFLLRYWEELDVAETAAAMGCSEGSVKTHCSRAAHTLAAALKAKGIEL